MIFPEKLRELRKTSKLSQEDIGELLDVHFITVSRWECGTATPSMNSIIKLATLFSVSTDELLCVNEGVENSCHISPRR